VGVKHLHPLAETFDIGIYFEVGAARCCLPRHPTHFEPSCHGIQMASYNAASDICLTHFPWLPHHPTHFEAWRLDLNGVLDTASNICQALMTGQRARHRRLR
jgi:hypothetical protein